MAQGKEGQEVPFPTHAKFLIGGTTGMIAAFCVHPMDFMKTRMQMSGSGGQKKLYESSGHAIVKIIQKEGPLAIYSGASACVLRQAVYTTMMFGLYTTLFGLYSHDGTPPSFRNKAMFGMLSGLFAGFLSTPLDLCVVRMITDGTKPRDQQFKYKHVFNALARINKEEGGIPGLYRGAVPTTVRAIAVSGCVLATYSQTKEFLLKNTELTEGLLLHFYVSIISGFVTSVVTLPTDIVKIRAQSQAVEPKLCIGGIFLSILSNEGPSAFWKGLTPYFARLMPITVITFVLMEQLTYYYHIYVLGNKNAKSNL